MQNLTLKQSEINTIELVLQKLIGSKEVKRYATSKEVAVTLDKETLVTLNQVLYKINTK